MKRETNVDLKISIDLNALIKSNPSLENPLELNKYLKEVLGGLGEARLLESGSKHIQEARLG